LSLVFVLSLFSIVSIVSSTACITANNPIATTVIGQPLFSSYSGPPSVSQTRLGYPTDVTFSPTSGKLFVCDTQYHRVLRYLGTPPSTAGYPQCLYGQPTYSFSDNGGTSNRDFSSPTHVHVDKNDNLWVSDTNNNRVVAFASASTTLVNPPAYLVLGQTSMTVATAATTRTNFYGPRGIDVDANGTLWVADYYNHRVLRFDNAATRTIGTNNADQVLGHTTYTDSSAGTTGTKYVMYYPVGVAVDATGTLYVVEEYSYRVTRFTNARLKANGGFADAVLGQSSFGVQITVPSAQFYYPYGVAVHSEGNRLFVADTYNNRVLVFANANTFKNGQVAQYSIGQLNPLNFSQGGYAQASQTELYYPYGLAFNKGKPALWIADYGNYRVLGYCTP